MLPDWQSDAFSYGRKEGPHKDWIAARGHVNVQRPVKIKARRCYRSAALTSLKPLRVGVANGGPLAWLRVGRAVCLSLLSDLLASLFPMLFALGGLSSWGGQTTGDYLAVTAGFCISVCTADLFGEDLLQRRYRADRVVLAHVARHPGATTRQVAQAVDVLSAASRQILTGSWMTVC